MRKWTDRCQQPLIEIKNIERSSSVESTVGHAYVAAGRTRGLEFRDELLVAARLR